MEFDKEEGKLLQLFFHFLAATESFGHVGILHSVVARRRSLTHFPLGGGGGRVGWGVAANKQGLTSHPVA